MNEQTKSRTRKPIGKTPGPFARAMAAKRRRQPDDVDLAAKLLTDAQAHGGTVNSQRAFGRALTEDEREGVVRAIASLADRGLIHQPRGGAWQSTRLQ